MTAKSADDLIEARTTLAQPRPVTSLQPSALRKLFYVVVNAVQASGIFPGYVRARIIGLLGHDLSAKTFIAQQVFFSGGRLKTEGTVSINAGCHIGASADIYLADGVRIGCRAMLVTTAHRVGTSALRAGETIYRPIRVGRGSWIGAGATILPGVSIAPGCIIAAGAVVASDTRADGLYAGVPARRIKTLEG